MVGVPKGLVPGTCMAVIGCSEIERRTKGIGRRVIRTRSTVIIDTIDNVDNNETDRTRHDSCHVEPNRNCVNASQNTMTLHNSQTPLTESLILTRK